MKAPVETGAAALAALLDALHVGVLWLDGERRVVFANRAYRRLWGFGDAEKLHGLAFEALIGRAAEMLADAADFRRHAREVAQSGDPEAAYALSLNDGRQLRVTAKPMPGGDGCAWLFENVTAGRVAQLHRYPSEIDPLTGLHNRRRFAAELDRLLAGAARRGRQMGVVLIAVDALASLNERYGQDAGNEVLVTMAEAIGAGIRRDERFFRLGGDEFAILAPEVGEEEVAGLVRRLRLQIDGLSFEFAGDGEIVTISASIGAALYPLQALNADDLMRCARAAVQERGARAWGFYEPPAPAL